MSDARRGLPLLSGPPPTFAPPDSEGACRKCSKEFHLIFLRSRKCNHCGYLYCHSCSDFQALMPRSDNGYDSMNVCGFCIEFLTVTAAGRNSLKELSLGKLKRYVNAYSIDIDRAVEKDDIIDSIVAARGTNGCLPPANENFYRKYSVPNRVPPGRSRGVFSRSGQSPSSAPPRPPPRPASGPTFEFPRPDLEPDYPFSPPNVHPSVRTNTTRPQQHNSPPRHRPNSPHTPLYRQNLHPGHSRSSGDGTYGSHIPPAPPYATRPQQRSPSQPNYHSHSSPPHAARSSEPPLPLPRTRASSVAPPPSLDQLVEMSTDSIGSLSISALKSILFTNHVTTGLTGGLILEKSDLVRKVLVLVENERAERVRQRQMEEREEMERLQRSMETMYGTGYFERGTEEQTEGQQDGVDGDHPANDSGSSFDVPIEDGSRENEGGHGINRPHSSSPPAPSAAPRSSGSALDRPGMCVICQDEDANIAIIDCGHMAMCRGCSELVMASSKECPLCRTRIVTEARLLRIFRT